jgi:hypothetical protein
VCGVISIFCPFAFADAATIAIVIVMIVYAFSDFINAALLQRDIDTISDFFEEHSHKQPAKKSSDKKKEPKRIKEAEVVEKDDEK